MRIKLKDLGTFGNGAQRPKYDGSVPVYGGNGILGWSNQSNYPAGTIIIGRVGAYCGSVFLALERCWVSDNAIAFCPNDQCNSLFLAYYLKLINLNSFHIGSSQPLITQEIIGNIEIDLPCCEVQTSIAKTLSSIDSKIDNNNAICADLEGMAKLLYDYWFVQFDFPDENGKPYKSSGGKMVWNEELKREIPEGWETVIIGNISKANRGVSYSGDNLASEGTPMLTLGFANKDGSFNTNGIQSVQGIDDKNKYISPYDLVMYNTDMSALKHVIGRTILVPPLYEHCYSSHHLTTISFEDTQLKWLFYYLTQTEFFRKYIKGFATGTNVIGLDYRGVEDFCMAVPTQEVLNKFVQVSIYVEKIKGNVLKENVELSSLREFLLPMLMNGQVKVKGA